MWGLGGPSRNRMEFFCRVTEGLYRDSGKENGSDHFGV